MIKVHFCRSRGIAGWVIRLCTMSRWNHVAIEVEGRLYQADSSGVHETTSFRLANHYHRIAPVIVDAPNPGAAHAFLSRQLGKRYDWLALLAMPFRRNWGKENRWFCSELAAAALAAGGRSLRIKSHRVTPRDLWAAL